MTCNKAIDINIMNEQIRSYRKCESGCSRYIVSMALFLYHIVMGLSSVGGPKQLKSEHRRSGGNRFDSIIAIL